MSESPGIPAEARAVSRDWFAYVRSAVLDPDTALDDTRRGLHGFGLATASVLVVLVALTAYIHPLAHGSAVSLDWAIVAGSAGAAILVPLVVSLLALDACAGLRGPSPGLAFFTEKFGAALVLPMLMVLLSLPFGLIAQTQAWVTAAIVHAWLRGAGLALIHVAVFVCAYLFAAPRRLRVAFVFALGFQLTHRLASLLLQ